MRLTCHDCGSTVYISAEAPNCPECGAELESYLRALEYVRECYQQASEETLAGDDERALMILAQGLSAVNASELHLLAALIYRKQGEYDGMHRHVAAIPLDDPLRPEGEWLLRSHQQRQRAVRQAQRDYTPAGHAGKAARQLSPEFYAVPPTLGSPLRSGRVSPRRLWRSVAFLAALAIVAFLLRQPLGDGLALLTASPTAQVIAQPESAQPESAQPESAQSVNTAPEGDAAFPAPANTPTPLPATATSEPAPPPTTLPTPLPTATPPVPVVAEPEPNVTVSADPQPIAAANDALAAAVATTSVNQSVNQFELADYLAQAGRGDLAVLPIDAVLQDGRLALSGVVTLTSQRLEVLELAAQIPGVGDVDAIDLVVRLPETYTVATGDTLWTIAYYLYGDGTRWEELYAANESLLGNSILLAVGMELQVPER